MNKRFIINKMKHLKFEKILKIKKKRKKKYS